MAPFQAPVVPPTGLVASGISAPLILPEGEVPVSQVHPPDVSVVYIYVPFLTDFSWGDASLQEAVSRSGLREVHYADYRYSNFLPIFRMVEITFYGRR